MCYRIILSQLFWANFEPCFVEVLNRNSAIRALSCMQQNSYKDQLCTRSPWVCVWEDELITLQTAKQTTHCINCVFSYLFVSKRQQLSLLLYLPLEGNSCILHARIHHLRYIETKRDARGSRIRAKEQTNPCLKGHVKTTRLQNTTNAAHRPENQLAANEARVGSPCQPR